MPLTINETGKTDINIKQGYISDYVIYDGHQCILWKCHCAQFPRYFFVPVLPFQFKQHVEKNTDWFKRDVIPDKRNNGNCSFGK